MRVSLATLAGQQGRCSEDWCGASLDVAIVLDGVSSAREDEGGCRHGTPWYVRNLGLSMLDQAALDRSKSLTDALAESIEIVARMHEGQCDLGNPGTPSATLAALRTSSTTVEYIVLSDATAVLGISDEVTAITDRRVSDVIADDMDACLSLPTGSPAQLTRINAMIRGQRERRNKPGGYWLAGAVPEAAREALTGRAVWAPGDAAMLLSDGAASLVDAYARTTWPGFVAMARRDGVGEVLRAVREAEAEDPLGERWPRLKRSDDATAILVQPDVREGGRE